MGSAGDNFFRNDRYEKIQCAAQKQNKQQRCTKNTNLYEWRTVDQLIYLPAAKL